MTLRKLVRANILKARKAIKASKALRSRVRRTLVKK